MNAQISIIIKSFEINNSQQKETRQNCNEKKRAEGALPEVAWPLAGAAYRSLVPSAQATSRPKESDQLPITDYPFGAIGLSTQLGAPNAERRRLKAASQNSSAVCKTNSAQTEQTILFLLRRHLRSIRLPKTRTLYTVLRSPHIDKKSREQFEMKIHKQCFFIQSETKYLRTQLLLLKLQDIPGVQCKIVVNYKTRLGLVCT